MSKPPFPPFTLATATQKVRAAEDAWNSKNPDAVSLAYTPESVWRNRTSFLQGRDQIKDFLRQKWETELEYRLVKELWCFHETRIAVRFAYEWHNAEGQWFRSYGNENWDFAADGLMRWRLASINDLPITQQERKFLWQGARRPDDHPGLSALGL